MKPYALAFIVTISHGFQNRFHVLKTSESVVARGFVGIFKSAQFSEMTVLLGFLDQKFSRNEISFSGEHGSMVSRNEPRSIVASRAKVAPFALCLLDGMAPKPLSPAQALWLFCESAGFVIVMSGVFIEVVIFWYDMLATIWCTVPFQYFVVIPNVLQVCELRFQFIER